MRGKIKSDAELQREIFFEWGKKFPLLKCCRLRPEQVYSRRPVNDLFSILYFSIHSFH